MRALKRRQKSANTEQLLKREICDWLWRQGAYVVMYAAMRGGKQADGSWRTYKSPYMPNGVPDVLACWKGQFVGIEVKRPKQTQAELLGAKPRPAGKVSDDQRRQIEKIKQASGSAFVAYSLEDVISVLSPNRREVITHEEDDKIYDQRSQDEGQDEEEN